MTRRAFIVSLMIAILGVGLVGVYQAFVVKSIEAGVDSLTNQALYASIPDDEASGPHLAFSVVVPNAENELVSPSLENSGTAVFNWAVENGGVAADALRVPVDVYGTVDHPLILTGIRAELISEQSPPAWTYFPPMGAGDLIARPVHIDLDSADRIGVPEPDDVHGEWDFPVQVSSSEAERFYVIVGTETRDATFNIFVDYTDNGEPRTQIVDTRGVDLRVAASGAASSVISWQIVDGKVTFQEPS